MRDAKDTTAAAGATSDGVDAHPGRPGKTIGFLGAQRGVGTTSALLNVALVLAHARCETLALELHPSFSSFALQLGLSAPGELDHLMRSGGPINQETVASLVQPYQPGLSLVLGPCDPVPPMLADGELMDRIVHWLSLRCDYLLVDLTAGLSPRYHQLVRHLDHVVVVLNPGASSVKSAREAIDKLRSLSVGNARISSVIIQKEAVSSLSLSGIEEVKRALEVPISGVVPPAGRTFPESSGNSSPVPLSNLAFAQIATELLAEVNYQRLHVALISSDEETAKRLSRLLEASTTVRFDVSRALTLDAVSPELAAGAFDAVLLVHDGTQGDPVTLVARVSSLSERAAILLVTRDPDSPGAFVGVEVGAQEQVMLEKLDSYWLPHLLRTAIDRRRLLVRVELEARNLKSCDLHLRRMIGELLRQAAHDPRMV